MKKLIWLIIIILIIGLVGYKLHLRSIALEKARENALAHQEVSVLIREGLSAKDINNYLKTNKYLSDDSFLTLAKTPLKSLPKNIKKYSWLNNLDQDDDLEGYLFPDTYRLYKDFTASDLINKMLANLDEKLNSGLLTKINNSGHSLKEIITMASILEKEVRSEQDMKIVSGIFWDRIKIGQALQSCATLAFVLGVNKTQYSYADTQIVSPYNTYKNKGLPPGPITNPGLRAIGAAVEPIKTDYNYFLSRPDTGETVFAKTLDQHNANKAKYLK